ncbi:NUDIX hydrolase [Edaphobacillus lindanitolerans]|uniref:NUDIX domain-containing protein n=1 Tax=Edaphobacillus lindanitolerans TaxID=550447 RepID=A0A1U7PNK5_9BACI|nr:NUDIX domain-containing protein [Edaphobacillus lindanitolerans]SIT92946.1 NUDIX domain-containing protein [Edaphobacillus lindanitolerans]
MELRRKVLAYITRGEGPDQQLLVYTEKNHPESGAQVPGGTIDRGELLMDALYREIEEETGISKNDLVLVGKLAKNTFFPRHRDRKYERNIFQLKYTGKGPEEWEHIVTGRGKDRGKVLALHWTPVEHIPELAGRQDMALDAL